MENMKTNQEKITSQDINSVSKRWILASQITWNYEKMMAIGYLYSILPVLRKLYKKEEELKAAMKNHVQFFNTTPHMGGFILGIDIATEAEGKNSSKDGVETANGIKTGLMGPFAGVGDTIFGVLIPTICGSIAAYMGQQGNVTGVVIWILVNIAIMAFRYLTVGIGYREGTKLIASAKDKLDALTSAATLLGITVVGALIPTVVRANIRSDHAKPCSGSDCSRDLCFTWKEKDDLYEGNLNCYGGFHHFCSNWIFGINRQHTIPGRGEECSGQGMVEHEMIQ